MKRTRRRGDEDCLWDVPVCIAAGFSPSQEGNQQNVSKISKLRVKGLNLNFLQRIYLNKRHEKIHIRVLPSMFAKENKFHY